MTPDNGASVQRYSVGPDDAHPGWNEMVPSPTGPWVRLEDVINVIGTMFENVPGDWDRAIEHVILELDR